MTMRLMQVKKMIRCMYCLEKVHPTEDRFVHNDACEEVWCLEGVNFVRTSTRICSMRTLLLREIGTTMRRCKFCCEIVTPRAYQRFWEHKSLFCLEAIPVVVDIGPIGSRIRSGRECQLVIDEAHTYEAVN